MLIRSQDKKRLMNLDGLTHLQIDKYGTVYKISAEYCKEDGYQYIGTYSTEAKAIKVLDMIQKAYTPSAEDVQLYIEGILPEVVLTNRVFQMPQDEEV